VLWEIIRKEFHSNIITARFIVEFIICLMLAMFVWVFLALIYPNASGFLADPAYRSTMKR
jgi:hypothetical protein